MIIDCHGHYTTVPQSHSNWRQEQKNFFSQKITKISAYPTISDDEISESIETNQLRLMQERGIDMTVFSPRASAMEHHTCNIELNNDWAIQSNNLIARVVNLYPDHFIGVCQLPQFPLAKLDLTVKELERCVNELNFVGCNLNPDPSGGHWTSPPITDKYWYPLFEKMAELDIPAMIHVSTSCNDCFHTTGAHYINADTTAFMQLITGDLFKDFPNLKLIIPHGGGAAPYHWGRYRGLADMLNRPNLQDHVMKNVYFDTCVYHQKGINLLFDIINHDNLLFGSEMVGAVRGIDPETGYYFDDTRRYIDQLNLSASQKAQIYEGNARRVFARLDKQLQARGKHYASLHHG